VKSFFEQQPQDPENMNGKVVCDGKVIAAGQSVAECRDFLLELIRVFHLQYPKGASLLFRFLQFEVYKIRYGSERIPSSVNMAARMFGF
jgi:hypothetical protein